MTALSHSSHLSTRGVDVAAYYFPGFHADERTSALHGPGWTEWQLVQQAKPRFAGHRQPRVPEWGYFDESDPEWAYRQAKLAADSGIDAFIVDWYWYEGQDFLNKQLDRGLLRTAEELPIRFALMWANHHWVDIHPATALNESPLLMSGAVDDRSFDLMSAVLVERYFAHPRYFTVDGQPYFSIYEPQTLIDGLGSLNKAAAALDRLRERVAQAGKELHLNLVCTDRTILPGEKVSENLPEIVEAFRADSVTSYVWIHHYDPAADGFPVGDFDKAGQANERVWTDARSRLSVPYFPNVTTGWDSTPRTVQSDVFENRGYPWTSILDPSPHDFARWMKRAVDFASSEPTGRSVVTVNAWNEWTEGSYLLPDTTNGLAFLHAIREAVDERRHSSALDTARPKLRQQ